MNKEVYAAVPTPYIEIPRTVSKPTKIDAILQQRIIEFRMTRRRIIWLQLGL